jgi:hypothetical protein
MSSNENPSSQTDVNSKSLSTSPLSNSAVSAEVRLAELTKLIVVMQSKAPSNPQGSTVHLPAAQRGPWALDEEKEQLTVAVPSNLEAFADDFQAIAAASALGCLNIAGLVTTTEWPLDQRVPADKKVVAQYWSGVAHALRHAATVAPPSKPYTGSFGDGYYWITNMYLENNKIPANFWYGKGSPPSSTFAKGAWGTKVPAELLRLEALCRRAAQTVSYPLFVEHYCKTYSQLVGHGIKATLPWSKEGVLSSDELKYIKSQNKTANDLYNELKAEFETKPMVNPLTFFSTLSSKIQKISQELKNAEILVDNITNIRFKALNEGLSKKELAQAQKKPIKERVLALDPVKRIVSFNPLQLIPYHMKIDERTLGFLDKGIPQAFYEVRKQFDFAAHKAFDKSLHALCSNWADEHIGSIDGGDFNEIIENLKVSTMSA